MIPYPSPFSSLSRRRRNFRIGVTDAEFRGGARVLITNVFQSTFPSDGATQAVPGSDASMKNGGLIDGAH
jgi:hypothetical protein